MKDNQSRFRTPVAVAQLIVINAALYAQEKKRKVNRYRFGRATLLAMTGRSRHLPAAFILELEDELAEMGWQLVELDGQFAVMRIDNPQTWLQLSPSRVQHLLGADEQTINAHYGLLCAEDEPPIEEDGE